MGTYGPLCTIWMLGKQLFVRKEIVLYQQRDGLNAVARSQNRAIELGSY